MIGPPLFLAAGFGLGVWLKKHPGHPVLQAIDDAMLNAAKTAKLQQAANVLAGMGIMAPTATATSPAPAVASQPPATAAK